MLTIVAFGTLWLTLRRHPRAPLVAALVGLWSAIGVAASHLLPHWSAFSDPYPDLDVDAVSWAAMLLELATAAVLGLLGLRELRAQGARTAGAGGSERRLRSPAATASAARGRRSPRGRAG
jgi:hypothetical protein